MRVLIQRVISASVAVEGETIGAIDRGYMLLVGVTHTDSEATVALIAAKIINLRLFEDSAGQMNLSLPDASTGDAPPAVLVVSQFTLYASTKKGRRPSFTDAAPPEIAKPLVDLLCARLRANGVLVAEGRFGAHMRVTLINDGPVTIWLDSEAV